MKKIMALVVILGLVASAILLAALGYLTYEVTKEPDACTSSLNVSPAGDTGSGTLTVKGVEATPEQLQNAAAITTVAVKNDLPARAAEIAIMTAIQESTLVNIPYGYPGSTSIGLFQQIEAWGPRKVRMDPFQSAEMFYLGGRAGQRGLVDVPEWQNLDRGDAAQQVQGSAFPDAYAAHEAEAIAIVAEMIGEETVISAAQDCENQQDPIEAMVQAMESKVGQSLASIGSSDGAFTIGTFNVHGSNHTGHESAMQRMETQAPLINQLAIGVLGLQELRPDQRQRLMTLAPKYEIFPEGEVYGSRQMSANSIIWDSSQFEFVSGRATPMPFYFGGQELDIPLVELKHIDSGLVITVVNTHDPAKPIYDRLRYLNAQAHAELVDRLAAQGKTVFFTGDFNSGFKVRDDGNTTYQNLRPNLTWCIMTSSGVQINGYDDALGRTGCSQQTTEDLGEGPVDHVYVPRDGVSTIKHTIVREGTASDHPLVYVDMAVGDEGAVEEGTITTSPQLISWAAEQGGGFALPSGFEALSNFTQNAEGNVTGEFISAESIAGGTAVERGDMPVLKNDTMGVFTGASAGGPSFRVVTWNIQVGPGYQARVDRAHQRLRQDSLGIVGYQEVENKAMFDALAAKSGLGDRYAIYPENPNVVAHGWIGARPIIYDTARFEKVEGSSFSFPRMHLDHPEKQPVEFPLLTLRDKLTGQEFAVLNVHFAAFKRYAKERYESGVATRDVVQELVDDGTPVVLTGDFNSNYYLRMDSPNPTYQGERDNMAYCQFTAGGLMNNARDLAETAPRFAPGSYCPRTQADGDFSVDHIYLSSHFDVPDGGFGEVTGTLSDHGTAPYADVVIAGAQSEDSGQSGLGSYVGLGTDGATVESLTLHRGQLLGVVRLSVASPGLVAGDWTFPLPVGSYNYSSPYGPRNLGEDDFHNGADFGTQGVEVPLVAMHAGTVIRASYDEAWGNYLLVETNIAVPDSGGETYKYMYAHMSRYALGITLGTQLEAGQAVGNVGDTGNSLGEHLHLNICTDMECLSGNAEGAIDPIPFLASVGIRP